MSEEKKENTILGDIRGALATVQDPEIGRNIVELGLVYDILYETENKFCQVDMTLTSPMCPFGPLIIEQSKGVVYAIENVKEVDIQIVWEPQWDPRSMTSEDVKLELGIWDEEEGEQLIDEDSTLKKIKEKLHFMEVEYLNEKHKLTQLVSIDDKDVVYEDGFCQIPLNLSTLNIIPAENILEQMKSFMKKVRNQITFEIRQIKGVRGIDIVL